MKFLKIVKTYLISKIQETFLKEIIVAAAGNAGISPEWKKMPKNGVISEGSIFFNNISKNSLKFYFSIEFLAKIFKFFSKFLSNLCISPNPAKR